MTEEGSKPIFQPLNSQFQEEGKKAEDLQMFNEARTASMPYDYDMPTQNMNDFQKDFCQNDAKHYIFVDKSFDALSLLMHEERLIFIQRPRRFGKTFFLGFVNFLCIYGMDDPDLRKKYPELQIFKEESPDVRKFRSKKFLPIMLDFASFNFNDVLDKQICLCLITEITSLINTFKKRKCPKSVKVLSNILAKCESEVFPSHILQRLKEIQDLHYDVILLIDEYETPIISKMGKHNDKCITETDLKNYERDYQDFFTNLKSLCGPRRIISKVIMTGVMSLRHLGLFSGQNSFTNFSYEDLCKTTFGFTFQELKQNPNIKNLIINLLIKHNCLKITDEAEKLEAFFIKYLTKIFEHYNGFCFTSDIRKASQVISPISFVNHIKFLEKNAPNPTIPFHFKNYWTSTGSTKQLSVILPKKRDPYHYPKLIYDAQNEPVNKKLLNLAHDFNIENMPLNLILFYAGYFTIKKAIGQDSLQMGWTNKETKNAFYKMYNDNVGLKENFIMEMFKELKNSPINDKQIMINFSLNIEKMFIKMLEKYYDEEQEDNEHIAIFRLLFDMQVAIISNDSELEVFDRWKLTNDDNLRVGGIPDLILFSKNYKIVFIIEFQKLLNKYYYCFFYVYLLCLNYYYSFSLERTTRKETMHQT